jgi:hypothetical protein
MNLDRLIKRLKELDDERLRKVAEYVDFLCWQDAEGECRPGGAEVVWTFDLVEHFGDASAHASGDPSGMEVHIGRATCGGEERPALFAHPPLRGDALVEYLVPVPADVGSVSLRLAVGIRDGAQIAEDNLVGFKVLVNNGRVWGTQTNALRWEEHEIPLPLVPGDIGRVSLATEALVDHRWSWAVWGGAVIVGYSAAVG